jgi:hypothetical protein
MPQPPVIRVPKPQRSSYQPDRPLARSTLLQSQVNHFLELEKGLPPEHKTGLAVESIKTEGQAAEYIRRMTEKIHELHKKA